MRVVFGVWAGRESSLGGSRGDGMVQIRKGVCSLSGTPLYCVHLPLLKVRPASGPLSLRART